MSSILNKLSMLAAKLKGEAILVSQARKTGGSKPDISFSNIMECYRKHPATKAFVDFLSYQTVGPGFYTSCARESEYANAPDAKNLVDDFCEDNDLDTLNQNWARELIASGNALAEKITPEKLEHVWRIPIITLDKVITNEYLQMFQTEWTRRNRMKLGFQQRQKFGGQLVPPENAIWFQWNPMDETGWGMGILRVLLEEYTWYDEDAGENRTRRSFMELMARLEKAFPDIFEKFGGKIEVYTWEKGTGNKIVEDFQNQMSGMGPEGGRFFTNAAMDIKSPPMMGRTQTDVYVNHFWDMFCLAGETPLPKLFTTPGFTEASARAALDLADRMILSLQRLFKRKIEREIFWPVIEQKYDPRKADVRLNWGLEEKPEITVDHWIELAKLQAEGVPVVRIEEIRENLKKFGFELWEPETEEGEQT